MPRILRNYLISFLIIGTLLGVIHGLDLYFNPREGGPEGSSPMDSGAAASRP